MLNLTRVSTLSFCARLVSHGHLLSVRMGRETFFSTICSATALRRNSRHSWRFGSESRNYNDTSNSLKVEYLKAERLFSFVLDGVDPDTDPTAPANVIARLLHNSPPPPTNLVTTETIQSLYESHETFRNDMYSSPAFDFHSYQSVLTRLITKFQSSLCSPLILPPLARSGIIEAFAKSRKIGSALKS